MEIKSAIDEIIDWAATLPSWQSHAVKLLLTKGSINRNELNDILLSIKKNSGIIGEEIKCPLMTPIQRGDISGAASVKENITLKKIKNTRGINAIPDNSEISFSDQGLTVIYGNNGTGKSGFSRVLKKACKARDENVYIFNNVFEKQETTPQVEFEITANEKEKSIIWSYDGFDIQELANILVYDSKSARIILTRKNIAYYLPYGTDVFKKLTQEIKEIKKLLSEEKPDVGNLNIDGIKNKDNLSEVIKSIDKDDFRQKIELDLIWNDDFEKQLNTKRVDLLKLEENNPRKELEKLALIKKNCNSVFHFFANCYKLLSSSKIEKYRNLVKEYNQYQEAASIASNLNLEDEDMNGLGNSTWKKLWNAAKEFSISYAYPDEEFPKTDNAKCVLCLQPIDNKETKDRFEKFKEFVEDKTQVKRDELNAQLTRIENEIEQISGSTEILEQIKIQLIDFDKPLYEKLAKLIDSIESEKNKLLNDIKNRTVELKCVINFPNKKEYLPFFKDIKNQIKVINEDLNESHLDEKISTAKKEIDNLNEKKILFNNKSKIIKYHDDFVLAKKYEDCLSGIEHRSITQKGKEIISSVLEPDLIEALNAEIESLGGKDFPIKINITASEGKVLHNFEIDTDGKSVKNDLTEVFSEGEQNIISIAGFLAELNTTDEKNPIIFDDPVSSLDHRYKRKIAERLKKESEKRQTIVFTHDLTFLNMLNCDHITIKTIERWGNKPGYVNNNLPWDGLSIKKRIRVLRSADLQQLTKSKKMDTDSDYIQKAKECYSRLRETWERLVEEVVINSVVTRFSPCIHTNQLKQMIKIKLSDEDVKIIEDNMSKCSTFFSGHDTPNALIQTCPEPTEIENDIKVLDDFRSDLEGRKNKKN